MQSLRAQIEDAENRADEIIAEAGAKARDMLSKAIEESCAAERQERELLRAEAAKRMKAGAVATGDEIKALELRRAIQREGIKRKAQSQISRAGLFVFERVVGHGGQ